MNACRRCGGWLIPDAYGDRYCVACGEGVYDYTEAAMDRLADRLWKALLQSAGQAKGAETKRRRRVERLSA